MKIVIVLMQRRLYVYRASQLEQEFPVAIGAPATPTPLGHFRIINKAENPGGPFGAKWLGLSLRGYGIHGTNDPTSIGKAVSKGCVRLYNPDIKILYAQTPLNTAVNIIADINGLPPNFAQPSGTVHQVVAGDTLYSLSQTYHTSVQSIITKNHLYYTDGIIYVGQILLIP